MAYEILNGVRNLTHLWPYNVTFHRPNLQATFFLGHLGRPCLAPIFLGSLIFAYKDP